MVTVIVSVCYSKLDTHCSNTQPAWHAQLQEYLVMLAISSENFCVIGVSSGGVWVYMRPTALRNSIKLQ